MTLMNNSASCTLADESLSPEQQLVSEYYQHQALLCQWFATLLAGELDQAHLHAYLEGQANPLLAELALIEELLAPVQQLRQAINTLSLLQHPQLELAADFAGLFLSDARHSPAPYASLYMEDRRFNGPALVRMQARLTAAGMAVSEQLKEPADHVSIMLEYLAHRYRQLAKLPTAKAEAEVATFVAQELAPWLPQWVQRAKNIDTASQFYPAVMALLCAYITA